MDSKNSASNESRLSVGRRDRNKKEKLERITEAARTLFAERSVNDVTTSEIAQRADVAAGTVFLYAKNKGELLLMAQNNGYYKAHELGLVGSSAELDTVNALMALLSPIVECNRENVENGRKYLQEVLFGLGQDAYRLAAFELMAGTQRSAAEIIQNTSALDSAESSKIAQIVMAILFLTLSSPANEKLELREIYVQLEDQIAQLFQAKVI